MSDVRGTISVDVAFTDSTTVSGAQSLKTITLRDATEYTSGKVAIVTGTVGTSAVTVDVGNLDYRNASGSLVAFGVPFPIRFAFSSSGSQLVECKGGQAFGDSHAALLSKNNSVCVSDNSGGALEIKVLSTAGTASYTLVLYGT